MYPVAADNVGRTGNVDIQRKREEMTRYRAKLKSGKENARETFSARFTFRKLDSEGVVGHLDLAPLEEAVE